MIPTLPDNDSLTLMVAGRTIGTVKVRDRSQKKIFGRFTPGGDFEFYRPSFELAVELARQFDAVPSSEPCDYALWDRLMAAYDVINRLEPTLVGLPFSIEEFAIQTDWSVEITFR